MITARLNEVEESKTAVFIPPPVRGMGGQTGFSMRLQNRANLTPPQFEQVANDFIRAANQMPGIRNVFTTFSTGTPQVYVDVDRDKAQMLKVPLESVFEALRVYLGSAYVNDFNMFGRTFRVTAQADAKFRVDPENVARIRVRNEAGQMVPIGNLVTFRAIAGPDRMPRYNLFPTVEVNGSTGAGDQHRPGHQDHGRPRRARATRGRHLRVDRSLLPGGEGGDDRLLHLHPLGRVRVPRARCAIRELVAAARHHPHRADVSLERVARRRHCCTAATSTS